MAENKVAEETTRELGARNLKLLESGRPVPGYSNTPELLAAHKERTGGKPYFRFPPEPNGFLHIGHAKSMNLNFGNAVHHGGQCYLRYDDTNPESEEQIYIDAIKEMALWMGWNPWKVTHTSDYFDELHQFALKLIKDGLAYVDHSTADELRKQREQRSESPWRNRSVEENLKLFDHMRQGRYGEGEATLRLKMDMKSDNPNMRDFIAYRIKYTPHPMTGDKWCIYPSYDYTHCIIDSLEDIDYSCCTLEFETRRESYFWVLDKLNLFRPHVWEFSRLNVTGSLLSKRKINALVEKKVVRGFDDPRLLTLAGMRRRGYTPAAINKFCDLVGTTRTMNVIDIKMLENTLRESLDESVERRLGVINPVLVKITNWSGENKFDAPNFPRDVELGKREMTFTNEFYIDRNDFSETDDNKKFYGVVIGRPVGLKYAGNMIAQSFERDASGKVTAILAEIDHERKVKPKTNISWVAKSNSLPVEFRLYDPLLTDDRAAIDPEFMKFINVDSETVCNGFIEANVAKFTPRQTCQLERFGYFTIDDDSKNEKGLVMNRVLTLQQDKDKGK